MREYHKIDISEVGHIEPLVISSNVAPTKEIPPPVVQRKEYFNGIGGLDGPKEEEATHTNSH